MMERIAAAHWPPESFRLSPGLRASAVSLLPWMSETLLSSLLINYIASKEHLDSPWIGLVMFSGFLDISCPSLSCTTFGMYF
ncbi:hypothetical protein V6N13_044536 [Hibiscus sabdariffa]|uniref:Uncharacterized protein n=1 Tax=Hibiscus sabdariffa TaxID=183260 RepID=A0ABR2RIV6_9ROSI